MFDHNKSIAELKPLKFKHLKCIATAVFKIWNQNLEKYARVENGYTSISNVMSSKNPGNRDKMESFFLGNDSKWSKLIF